MSSYRRMDDSPLLSSTPPSWFDSKYLSEYASTTLKKLITITTYLQQEQRQLFINGLLNLAEKSITLF